MTSAASYETGASSLTTALAALTSPLPAEPRRLFLDGRYERNVDLDDRLNDGSYAPREVTVKAFTKIFVIVEYQPQSPRESDPQKPIPRDEFEQGYFLAPRFHRQKVLLYGTFAADGTREPTGHAFASQEDLYGDWSIDLTLVPPSAYKKGWQP